MLRMNNRVNILFYMLNCRLRGGEGGSIESTFCKLVKTVANWRRSLKGRRGISVGRAMFRGRGGQQKPCTWTQQNTQDAQMWPGQVLLRGQVIKQENAMKTNNTRDLCFKLYNLEHDHNGCS